LRARPVNRRFRNGIEIVRGHQSGGRFVVISANGLGAQLANLRSYFVGIRAVAYHVTQAHNLFPASLGRSQSGIESGSIRVQIAKNENPHFLGCPKEQLSIDEVMANPQNDAPRGIEFETQPPQGWRSVRTAR